MARAPLAVEGPEAQAPWAAVCGAGAEPSEGHGTQRARPGRGGAHQGQEPGPAGGGEPIATTTRGSSSLPAVPTTGASGAGVSGLVAL